MTERPPISKKDILTARMYFICTLSAVSVGLGCAVPAYSFAQALIQIFIFTAAVGALSELR